jgi:ribonuclease J
MNLNLYGYNGQWLMIDCGVSFDEPLFPEKSETSLIHRVVCADPSFIAERKSSLQGICITHGHEDHVGAIADLWPRFQVPVYATPFTAAIIQRKLSERGLDGKVPLVVVDLDSQHKVGDFSISWLSMTHSIPEPSALLINTPVGAIFHTADWKMDLSPGLGQGFNINRIKAIQHTHRLLAVVGDSTNATKPGLSHSESTCYHGLRETIRHQQGRVVVSCFASNVARLISLAKIAQETQRYLCLLGRSLETMLSIARSTGYWPDDIDVINPNHVGYLPANEVLAVATGSQGEPRAALSRLAHDTHRLLSLDEGDTIIFSSIVIPGNEKPVERLVSLFEKRHIRTLLSETHPLPLHASGHPNEEELKQLYTWLQPDIAIPTHGEHKHLLAHAKIAQNQGIRKTYVGKNGDLFRIYPQASIRRGVVKAGRIALNRE